MWIVIIAFPILTVGWFLFDKWKMETEIQSQGGMAIVHKELINILIDSTPYCKILQEGRSYIYIGRSDLHYEIVSHFSDISVIFRLENAFVGKHMLKWSFSKTDAPDYIYFRIEKDIESYFNKKFSKITYK
ncbi:hypothetical protein [Mangrovibacterium diazotrophicum]|uniref:Uncharacterized protein n=1 Tax=Mangrovibacterium diazotrophicum TaxID=1261403 RepID=A0A419W3H8_9BACT|nr:hypothetical protein [Mangrovibacterium diazotrophicum]RKD90028.1 hypothetical protein BC643_0364 [Mangrovibacterium diazotrophicum]